jgi:isopenicillin N synthase-like dioxygenase
VTILPLIAIALLMRTLRCRDIAPFVHGHPAAREMVIAAVKRACEQVGFR